MRRDSIEKHLQHRPKPEDLIKEGILQGGSFILYHELGSITNENVEDEAPPT